MPANAVNRKDARTALAALFSAAMVGAGLPLQAVYAYQVSDFAGKSPVLVLLSSGSDREQHGVGTLIFKSILRFEAFVFVADADTNAGWTDSDVEDALDDIEQAVADVIGDNRSNSTWNYLEHAGASQIQPAVVGGQAYKMEIIPIQMEAIDV